MNQSIATCACGNVSFDMKGTPLLRFICHCTICQRFNNSSYADAIVYSSTMVQEPELGLVDFKAYKPPPNVQRGKCITCMTPIIEHLNMPLFPKLTIIPSSTYQSNEALPLPTAHFFYDQSVAEVNDEIQKYEGFVSSQCGFVKHLILAKFFK